MSTIRAIALMHQHVPGSNPSSSRRPHQPRRQRRAPSLKRRAIGLAIPLVLTGAVVLPACGSDSDGAAKTTTSVATAETVDKTTTTVADDGTITVTAVDFNYEGLPETVPAGTQFKLVNDAEDELHEFVAYRLPDDEERSADELIELPEDQLHALFGDGPPEAGGVPHFHKGMYAEVTVE